MTIHVGDAARQSGLSVDTIRYYESLGLIDSPRDGAGRRIFDADDVVWLVFLRRMRETNMPIAELQEYIQHRRAGPDGVSGVLEVLRRHLHSIDKQRAELAECAQLVEAKIAKYEQLGADGHGPGRPEVDLE